MDIHILVTNEIKLSTDDLADNVGKTYHPQIVQLTMFEKKVMK